MSAARKASIISTVRIWFSHCAAHEQGSEQGACRGSKAITRGRLRTGPQGRSLALAETSREPDEETGGKTQGDPSVQSEIRA